MASENPLATFLSAVRVLYTVTASGHPMAAQALQPALTAIAGIDRPNRKPERQVKPACQLLPITLIQASKGPLGPIASAFATIEPALKWTQNPNYNDEKMGAGYMNGYAYSNVVGPDGLVDVPGVLIGVLLLGPGRTYPPHAHPAAEVYHVMAGVAEWQSGDEPFSARRPGGWMVHPPWLPHATRTLSDTLLALYCWTGDVSTRADLLPKKPH